MNESKCLSCRKIFNEYLDIGDQNGHLSCKCHKKNYFNPEIPLLNFTLSFTETAKQMQINCDILKKQFSDHVDSEIKRFNKMTKENK